MQKVTSKLPSWDKTKTQSKKGFDKVWGWADKLGAPVNRLSNRIGSEAFWPTTLDKESDKAARILRSFCNSGCSGLTPLECIQADGATEDGFYTEEEKPVNQDGPKQKQRVLKKIPQKVIENAVGLAIFTTMRTGLWVSGAGGSGVLVARKEDGSWSPPSGIMLHTASLGFLVGVDIYDCVVVINNRKALEAFTKIRATLGGEISAVAGPVGAGGVLENDGKWKQVNRPVFTYLKSRGFYAGVQVDGTIIIERTDENARFYGETIGVADILAGKARHPPPEIKMLMETLKAAEGRTDVDEELMDELEGQPAPGDVNVEAPSDGKIFGIPDPEDPDPYGVLALEKEGLEIREAVTHSRPSSQQFEYTPSRSSPIYNTFYRRSLETAGTRSNRDSYASTPSSHRFYASSDAGTQTEPVVVTPVANSSPNSFSNPRVVEDEDDTSVYEDVSEVRHAKFHGSPYSGTNDNPWSSDEIVNGDHKNYVMETGVMETGVVLIDEKTEPRSLSNGTEHTTARVPPPLPARNPPATSVEFEEVSLKDDEGKGRQ
ncbi:LSB3-possible role in the regulation of actin cytoskeletal organization [Fusarium albosuccineum]|uniref:LSB3-possible role in the regulation of actin cytoskeletal organization n=1 Tax=Fusarium albosuccineum TaxID=1237068 RepID=A0A8H4P6I3_9HYPO|nr:LSB3-possible role in the regulation of actin cytoskeletal organization [Fusarium albosuccineum]